MLVEIGILTGVWGAQQGPMKRPLLPNYECSPDQIQKHRFLMAKLLTQVQKLLAKHKAEVAAVQAAMAEEARRALDVAAAQHELAMRQLKDRLLKVRVRACVCHPAIPCNLMDTNFCLG